VYLTKKVKQSPALESYCYGQKEARCSTGERTRNRNRRELREKQRPAKRKTAPSDPHLIFVQRRGKTWRPVLAGGKKKGRKEGPKEKEGGQKIPLSDNSPASKASQGSEQRKKKLADLRGLLRAMGKTTVMGRKGKKGKRKRKDEVRVR